jgi:hypothetical protein
MEFNISTPALLFSAISLLMLAYTNRFLALASLIRQHIQLYEEKKEENTLKQIQNFKIRLKVIKYTQIFGVISFSLCVISMQESSLKCERKVEESFSRSSVAQ